jgi:hypothetical protein
MSVGTEATQTKELWTGRGKDVRHEAADFDAPRNKNRKEEKTYWSLHQEEQIRILR